MSFRKFIADIQSVRDFEGTPLKGIVLGDIKAYLGEINATIGREKGFSFIMLEKGEEVFNDLEGVGGYSGIMIKSPHYIGLSISKQETETEFLGAYYMQAIVKKLFEMNLGSCWINVRNVSTAAKEKILTHNKSNINYLLAFGFADEKALKNKMPKMTVQNTASTNKTNPYSTKIVEASGSDKSRLSIGELVYLYQWGKEATYEELEQRGVAEIFSYVKNAPSYKNMQPCRLILKDGEAELAILNPQNKENYVDAGIMMYTLEGLAKDLGIPGKWSFTKEESDNKEYGIVAKIEL